MSHKECVLPIFDVDDFLQAMDLMGFMWIPDGREILFTSPEAYKQNGWIRLTVRSKSEKPVEKDYVGEEAMDWLRNTIPLYTSADWVRVNEENGINLVKYRDMLVLYVKKGMIHDRFTKKGTRMKYNPVKGCFIDL